MMTVQTLLGELCRLITDGKHGDCENQPDSGFFFLSAKDVRDGKLNYGDARQITETDFLDTHRRTQLEPDDLVISNSGTIGRMALVKNQPETSRTTFQKSVAILKPKHDQVLASWLYYFLQFDLERLIGFAGGTAQKNLLLRDLRAFSIALQPLPIQRKIASILSAYDSLIENNTRRIAILEAMAQTIYREWFVEFRFPGHEKAKLIESPLGKIPEGWEVLKVGDVIETSGGGTPSTKVSDYWDNGTVTWYSPTDLTKADAMFISSSEKKISQDGLKNSSAKLFPASSVMMTSRATIGVVSITTTEACTNQGFITCVPNSRLSSHLIYFWLHEEKEKIVSVASGATFKEISRGTFRKLPILVPPQTVRQAFDDAVAPMCRGVENLLKKKHILKTTRDLLLPKLISGKLDVEDLDIDTERPPEDTTP